MEVLEKIKNELATFDQKRNDLLKELQKEMNPLFKAFFENTPEEVESLGWTQYTPYFNDGDECIFRTNTDTTELYFNEEYFDDVEALDKGIYEKITEQNIEEHKRFNSSDLGRNWYLGRTVGQEGYFLNPDFNMGFYKACDDFSDLLSSIPEDFLKDIFGDHVKVTVFRSGEVEIEGYSHD